MFFAPHIFPGIVHPLVYGLPETNRAARPKQASSRSVGSNANSTLEQLSARDREQVAHWVRVIAARYRRDSGTRVHLPTDFPGSSTRSV